MLRKACFKGISQGGFLRRGIVCEKVVLQVKIVLGVGAESFDRGNDQSGIKVSVPILAEGKAKTKYRGPSLRSG
jgi:hypothetical protein